MPTSISRSAVCLAGPILFAVLAGGCAGQADEPAAAQATVTTTKRRPRPRRP